MSERCIAINDISILNYIRAMWGLERSRYDITDDIIYLFIEFSGCMGFLRGRIAFCAHHVSKFNSGLPSLSIELEGD